MYTTLDFVCLQSQIHIAIASMMDVILHAVIRVKLQNYNIIDTCASYLVKYIIQALIEVFKVKQDHCSANLHTDLDLVDIPTHLQNRKGER